MSLDQTAEGRRRFSEVSALSRRRPGLFDADIHPDWTVGGRPSGGYLLAMLARSAVEVGQHPDVLAASAHFLSVAEPGRAAVEVEPIRSGRSVSQLRARMTQDGSARVEALITTGTLDPDAKPYWEEGLPRYGPAGYGECEPFVPRFPDGMRVAIMDQVEVRLDAGSSGLASATPSGRGELRGWLSLPGDEPFDPVSLLLAVDSFPPATLDIETTGWVPTLELTAYVRGAPSPGPVRILQRAQLVQAQRVDEACFVWDSAGALVAQATQLAAIRLG